MISDDQAELAALWHLQAGESALAVSLEPEDFADPANKAIFSAIGKSIESDKGHIMDPGVVEDIVREKFSSLKEYAWLNLINSAQYIGAPYQVIDRLRKMRARREAEEFKSIAADEDKPQEFIGKGQEIQRLVTPAHMTTDDLVAMIKEGTKVQPTGFPTVDFLCNGGVEERGLFVIAARTGMGKTAMAINIAKNIVSAGGAVHFVTLEMAPPAVLTRAMQAFWGCSAADVRKNIDDMKTLPGDLRITAPGHMLSSTLADMHGNLDCDVFIVDYFGLLRVPGIDNSVQELERVSHELKRFAYDNKKPVILLAQLNRNMEMGGNREPMLSDLRGTGALEQDASVVSFLWDKNAQEETKPLSADDKVAGSSGKRSDAPQDYRWIIRKNRNGMTGMVRMHFNKQHMLFTEKDEADPFQ